jgi:hypothetical protein
MGVPLVRSAALAARLEPPIEELSYLESDVLVKTSSRRVSMTCHLTSLYLGWTDDMSHEQGWAPEVD